MLRTSLFLAIALAGGPVWADKQTQELAMGYQKEVAGCTRSRDGLAKMVERATEVAPSLRGAERTTVEDDAKTLAGALATVTAYFAELDAVLAVLRADPNAKYKSLERDLDQRDNKIRKLRAQSKQVLASTEAVTRRLVPIINAAQIAAHDPPAPKVTPATFPSGRTAELPALPGAWKVSGTANVDTVDYSDKSTTGYVTTRSFVHATCEQQRKAATTAEDRDIVDVSNDGLTRLAWSIRFTRKGHAMAMGCATRKDGGIVGIADVADPKLADTFQRLMTTLVTDRLH